MARDNIKSLSPLLLKKMPEFGKLINIPFQYKSESCDRSRKCYVNGDGKVFFLNWLYCGFVNITWFM